MITVYSKNNCPFCDRATALLESKDIPFKVIKMEDEPDAREFLMDQGLRSVPQIFKGVKVYTRDASETLPCNLYGVNSGVETLLKSNFAFGTVAGTTHSFVNTTAYKSYRFRPTGTTEPSVKFIMEVEFIY